MKRILLLTAAATLLAFPVFAQTQGSDESKSKVQAPAAQTTGQGQTAAPKTAPAARGANDVFCGGQYLGSDPDPKVRLQIMRDYKHECE